MGRGPEPVTRDLLTEAERLRQEIAAAQPAVRSKFKERVSALRVGLETAVYHLGLKRNQAADAEKAAENISNATVLFEEIYRLLGKPFNGLSCG